MQRPGFRAHHGVRADRLPQTEPLPELRMGPHPDFPVDGLQVAEGLDEESVHSPGGAHQPPRNPVVYIGCFVTQPGQRQPTVNSC